MRLPPDLSPDDPLKPYQGVRALVNYYHWLGARREALLNDLRTERLLAEAAGDAERANVLGDVLGYLPTATYTPQSDGSWKLTVPGFAEEGSLPTRDGGRVS